MISCFQNFGFLAVPRHLVASSGRRDSILRLSNARACSSGRDWKHKLNTVPKVQRNFDGVKPTAKNRSKADADRSARILTRPFGLGDPNVPNSTSSPLERLEQGSVAMPGQRLSENEKNILDKLQMQKDALEGAPQPLTDGAVVDSEMPEEEDQEEEEEFEPEGDEMEEGEEDNSIYKVPPISDAPSETFDESVAKENEVIRNTTKYIASHYRKESPRYAKKGRPLRTIQSDYRLLDTEGEDLILKESEYTLIKKMELEDEIKLDPDVEDDVPLDYEEIIFADDHDQEPFAKNDVNESVTHEPGLSNNEILLKKIMDQSSPSESPDEPDNHIDTEKSVLGHLGSLSSAQIKSIHRILSGTEQTYSTINQYIVSSKLGLSQCATEIFERIFAERQKYKLAQIRKTRRAELKRTKTLEKRRAFFQKRMETQSKARERRMQEFERLKNDPNMFYYPDINYWISREDLLNPIIRNAVSSVYNNPSWPHEAKRSFIDRVRNTLARLEKGPSSKKKLIIETVTNFKCEDTAVPTSEKDYEHYLAIPTTDWNATISEIEALMEPLDLSGKYDPPPPPDKKQDVVPPHS
ncbi:uncharacterized protein LOC126313346 isoform X2 [Schistocerca gregaria]|uniref:uncharacterized protein LOC126313346 isoform X2 n=1 Tax=Schistocerca gregaria TaxID=7010 RepID=UPI00211F18A2|nr:uncharacterized protein LOC126313346 isoform X2 [Schistocerca gregaria]